MSENTFLAFPKQTLMFIKDLEANNHREWFLEKKSVYDAIVKAPALQFCIQIEHQLQTISGITHTHKIYRIYRDLRFSKDKTPYNAHLHISFTPTSSHSCPPCWFFALEPNRLVFGAGVFSFDERALDVFRQRITKPSVTKLEDLLKQYKELGIRIDKPELKRVPNHYSKDHPQANLLRRKGLSAWIDFDHPLLATQDDFLETCHTSYSKLLPLFDWLMAR